jgi:viologen exporter family transport system permease protein
MAKSNILSAMEYRTSFLMQIAGMIVNDLALIGVWVIFFRRFPAINGWDLQDMALLFAIGTVNFALVMLFARGAMDLARTITRGELDYFFAFPQNILWHATAAKTDISALGDLVFGVGIFFFSGQVSLTTAGLFLILSLITAVIFYSFLVIIQSIAFYIGNFEEAAEQIYYALTALTLFPPSIFSGGLKIITLTILPAFFVAILPVQLLQTFSVKMFGILILFTVGLFSFAVWFFNRGLRRYESGNLISVKL